MAINWMWNDQMGKAYYSNGDVTNIFQGNCMMIALNQWEEDGQAMYNLAWFIDGENHLKNLLGLNKGYDNVFPEFGILKLRLNTRYKSVPKIISLMAKAKLDITIELYYE